MTRSLLDRHLNTSAIGALGSTTERTDIKSSLGPFRTLPDYRTIYPEVVIRAMASLYGEYNEAFAHLAAANREWDTDYRYCMPDNTVPVNWCIQIDMVGLPETFLQEAADMPEEIVREILHKEIFEIENSLAMYNLLENFFPRNGHDSFFKIHFRMVLDNLRRRFGKPVALLAVTEPKYNAMLASEFGKHPDERLTNAEIKECSGFDAFFGPKQFRDYMISNGGLCNHLLYVRSSDPVEKLKKPDLVIDHPLLGDIEMRKVIKAHALTFNVDAPEMESNRRINDTKRYMPSMGMAFPIASEDDLLSPEFAVYLRTQGIDPESVASDKSALHCKPIQGTYGCYGHISGMLTDEKFRRELRRNLRQRGSYIVQPEMAIPLITNATDGTTFAYIDRNFFGIVDGHPQFLGGIRNLMPMDTIEAREGRIHGNSSAVYAEIVC